MAIIIEDMCLFGLFGFLDESASSMCGFCSVHGPGGLCLGL